MSGGFIVGGVGHARRGPLDPHVRRGRRPSLPSKGKRVRAVELVIHETVTRSVDSTIAVLKKRGLSVHLVMGADGAHAARRPRDGHPLAREPAQRRVVRCRGREPLLPELPQAGPAVDRVIIGGRGRTRVSTSCRRPRRRKRSPRSCALDDERARARHRGGARVWPGFRDGASHWPRAC